MKGQIKTRKVLIFALLFLSLNILVACQGQKPESGGKIEKPDITPGFLTISGNGVKAPSRFTLAELKDMEEAQTSQCYSIVNNWPSKKYMVGRGIELSYLLKKAGIKDEAQTISFQAVDGYFAVFTRQQLEEKRFYYPKLMEGSEEEAQEVPAILAWEHREGSKDLSKASGGKLTLLLGQKGLNDVQAQVCVKDVAVIEVLTLPPGQWSTVQATPAPGRIKPGTEIVLHHSEQDQVKIYYTADGSSPSEKSLLYNPSTTYYQPELNKPLVVKQSVTIKAIAVGYGKNDSQIASFAYDVEGY